MQDVRVESRRHGVLRGNLSHMGTRQLVFHLELCDLELSPEVQLCRFVSLCFTISQ